ncbi:hypothetical protein RHMOL_Rhmol01G0042600 [Rhododendron molle]|uniref:Uncharacterized protein n=1 Tax=Rhododendron molle TaxID=49168 RepID=A0ACC0PZF9_RHOML|nr:hypothetical protein RHMOL_Rhmol01G0042600 [Rhododendron molle]
MHNHNLQGISGGDAVCGVHEEARLVAVHGAPEEGGHGRAAVAVARGEAAAVRGDEGDPELARAVVEGGGAPVVVDSAFSSLLRQIKRSVIVVVGAVVWQNVPSDQVEDEPSELLVNSMKHSVPKVDKLCSPAKESSLASETETGASSESSIVATEESSSADCLVNFEINNPGKPLLRSKELVPPYRPSADHRISDIASTSYEDQPSSDAVSANVGTNVDLVNDVDIKEKDESLVFAEVRSPSSLSPQADEVTVISGSVVSDSSISSGLLRDDALQETIPSGLGFLASDGEQNGSGGSVLHVDAVSISSSILSSSSSSEITSNREARRNSRRLFWDAFARRSSRRDNTDAQRFVFSTNDNDALGSHDRWLLDFGSDLLHDGVGSDSGYIESRSRNQGGNEWRRHSRSEVWGRLHDRRERVNPQTGVCPSGLHSDGTCSCGAILMVESSTRASISRIVMLAEALFEVLDEIHRQPVSLSLSVVSVPAPDAVVDSFPVKSHGKHNTTESADDDAQVCPLCRGDVREGFTEGPGPSGSNSESTSV